jgi:hypothetical protein
MKLKKYTKNIIIYITTFSFILNIAFFMIGYAHRLAPNTSRAIIIGDEIIKSTPVESAFVVFGNDWSSDITYYSKRKSFAVPDWFQDIDSVWANPQKYLGNSPLGVIVIVKGSKFAEPDQLKNKLANKSQWLIQESKEAYYLYPNTKL